MLTRLFTLMFLLSLAACSPFSQQQAATPQLPESFQRQVEQGVSLPDRWWEAFADPQLNRLQQQMLSGNLDLRQALYRLEQLEALRQTSGSGLWPSLNLNASASRDRSPGSSGSSTTTSSRVSLAAGYEVDLWNRLHDKEQAAELRLQAGEKDVQTLLLSLTAQLAETYFLASEQRAQLQLNQQQSKRNRQLLETATDRYRAGLATAEEIYQAQKNLAAQQAREPQLQAVLNQAENAIALLIGQYAGAEHTAETQLPALSSLADAGLPASLLTNRPDISAAFLQLQATDRELAAALADRLPAINLSASLGRSSTQLASGDINGAFWNLAASLAQPLFDGGRRKAEAIRQQAVRDGQLAGVQQTLLKAVQEVETALSADQNNAIRNYRLEQQRQISNRTLELNRSNYRSGLISSSALLASELEHLSILGQTLSAQRGWLSSRISLARALGGQWMQNELKEQQHALTATEDK